MSNVPKKHSLRKKQRGQQKKNAAMLELLSEVRSLLEEEPFLNEEGLKHRVIGRGNRLAEIALKLGFFSVPDLQFTGEGGGRRTIRRDWLFRGRRIDWDLLKEEFLLQDEGTGPKAFPVDVVEPDHHGREISRNFRFRELLFQRREMQGDLFGSDEGERSWVPQEGSKVQQELDESWEEKEFKLKLHWILEEVDGPLWDWEKATKIRDLRKRYGIQDSSVSSKPSMGPKLVYCGPTGKEKYLELLDTLPMDHEWETQRVDKEQTEQALQLIRDLEGVRSADPERVDPLLRIAEAILEEAKTPKTVLVKAHWCRIAYSLEYWTLFHQAQNGSIYQVRGKRLPALQACAVSGGTTLKELLSTLRARVRFTLIDIWATEKDILFDKKKKIKAQVRAWDLEETNFGEQNWAFVTLPVLEEQPNGLWVGVWTYGPLVDEARIASREKTLCEAGKCRRREQEELQKTLLKARSEGQKGKKDKISPAKCPYPKGRDKVNQLCRQAWMQARYSTK